MQLTLDAIQSLLIDLTNFINLILAIATALIILLAFRAFPFHHDYSLFISAARYLGLQHLAVYVRSLCSLGWLDGRPVARARYQHQQTADSIYYAAGELDSVCLRDPPGSNNYYVSGLINTGNTCFLNSVLQVRRLCCLHASFVSHNDNNYNYNKKKVLSSLPRLQLYLRQIQPSKSRPVSWFLLTTLRRLTQPLAKRSAFKPVDIVSVVSSRRINSRDQQDAQELFQLIMSAMDSEAQSTALPTVVGGLMDALKPAVQPKRRSFFSSSYHVEHRLENPFTGLLASRLSCMQCGYTEAIRHFSFNNVQLTLPDTCSTTLDECLKEFTAMEYLSDATCRKCALIDTVSSMSAQVDALKEQAKRTQERAARRSVLSDMVLLEKKRRELEHRLNTNRINDDENIRSVSRMSSKQVMFAKPPKVLCLHLSRSTYHPSGAVFKNSCRISFPENLDLSPYCTNGTLNTQPHEPISASVPGLDKYRLMGSIIHYGSHDFGHFVAYKRRLKAESCHCRQCNATDTLATDDSMWYRISDEQVDLCSLDEVLTSNPYMLLYEYVDPVDLHQGKQQQPIEARPVAKPDVTKQLPAAPPLQQGIPQCMPTTVTRRNWAGRRRQSAPVITC
ncbi:hypothetical protein BJV82DRAFT_179244 [Fennellomyces sp. T-0311]|nr:hypothetical protein BJV82DRAFT_179244 [Fennellomyces sp. T-0311]